MCHFLTSQCHQWERPPHPPPRLHPQISRPPHSWPHSWSRRSLSLRWRTSWSGHRAVATPGPGCSTAEPEQQRENWKLLKIFLYSLPVDCLMAAGKSGVSWRSESKGCYDQSSALGGTPLGPQRSRCCGRCWRSSPSPGCQKPGSSWRICYLGSHDLVISVLRGINTIQIVKQTKILCTAYYETNKKTNINLKMRTVVFNN